MYKCVNYSKSVLIILLIAISESDLIHYEIRSFIASFPIDRNLWFDLWTFKTSLSLRTRANDKIAIIMYLSSVNTPKIIVMS